MKDTQIKKLLQEIKDKQHIGPFEKDTVIEGYIKDAEFDINYISGAEIDYDTDLQARSLLRNYVLYARYKKLAEFKQLYGGNYAELQAKYYGHANI